MASAQMQEQSSDQIPRYARPYDWERINEDIHTIGGVILEQFYASDRVAQLNKEIDAYVEQNKDAGKPHSGSAPYNLFLGSKTLRLQGLTEKSAEVVSWIGDPELVHWAEKTLQPLATSVLLNAAELIQIGPDEPRQYLHRDSDSWPTAQLAEHPFIVNALIALDEFTLENGATWVAPGSWAWDRDRRAEPHEFVRAVMSSGDGLLFRGDILHSGGANQTDQPRRAISISYCAGWLRPVENSLFNIPRAHARALPPHVQKLLGYHSYDGSAHNGGLLGLYENGDPSVLLE